MSRSRLRVIKLGGSLFGFEPLVSAFRTWLATQSPAVNLLVPGGGRLVDVLREVDRTYHLDPAVAHWLAVRAMGIHAELAVSLWPEATLVTSTESIACKDTRSLVVLDTLHWLETQTTNLERTGLEASWRVTSDSIAAWVAIVEQAGELVLLKSHLPRCGINRQLASATGYVDEAFAEIAHELPLVRCVDLRSDGFPEIVLDS